MSSCGSLKARNIYVMVKFKDIFLCSEGRAETMYN